MSLSAELLGEIESALQDGSSDRRTEVLMRVTDLFVGRAAEYTEDQTTVFGAVMGHLISHVENRALVELSTRLAPIATAPTAIIRQLARNDQLEISGPVLNKSERLSDDDLTDIAKTKSQAHLSKIAGRSQLSEAVTDVLVDQGEPEVANEIATNRGARFSKVGMAMLVMRADGDDRLTESVAKRVDIAPRLFRQLLAQATETARAKLLAAASPEQKNLLKQILDDLAAQVGHMNVSPRDYAKARRVVYSFCQDAERTKSKIIEFADANRIAETIAALSLLSNVSVGQIDRLFSAPSCFGLMVLCKAITLDWTIARAVILARPSEAKIPTFPAEELREQYNKLSVPSAQKLLTFWRERQNVGFLKKAKSQAI